MPTNPKGSASDSLRKAKTAPLAIPPTKGHQGKKDANVLVTENIKSMIMGQKKIIPVAPEPKTAKGPEEEAEVVIEPGYEMLQKPMMRSMRSASVRSTGGDSLAAYEPPLRPSTPEVIVQTPDRRPRIHHERKASSGRKQLILFVIIVATFAIGLLFGMGIHYYTSCRPLNTVTVAKKQ